VQHRESQVKSYRAAESAPIGSTSLIHRRLTKCARAIFFAQIQIAVEFTGTAWAETQLTHAKPALAISSPDGST